jgi:hypothetical protein
MYGELVDLIFDPAPDVVTAVRDFFAGAAETLRRTGYADACPTETVALEATAPALSLSFMCLLEGAFVRPRPAPCGAGGTS